MKKQLAFLLLYLSFVLFGCNLNLDDDKITGNSDNQNYETIVHDGVKREYVIHIPSSYDSNIPSPVLINFHGFGGNAGEHADLTGRFYGLYDIADSENFIVVSPQGVEREKGAPEWDPGDNGSQNINDNDVFFTEQLIATIDAEYNINSSKIYAIGYSNGGMMAYGLACSRSNLIAAVGIMSGTMLEASCEDNAYTSIIHFHGIEDEVLPYDGNQDFQPIGDVVDFWLNHNNIPATNLTSTTLNNGDVIQDEYTGGSENTSVVLYTIKREFNKPGGHVWFSDDINGLSPNQILWDFLSLYSLDD